MLSLEVLARLIRGTGVAIGADMGGEKFVPCVSYNPILDTLTIQTRDCSTLEELIPDTPFTLIWNTHTGKIVGVSVQGWSQFDKSAM